MTDSPVLRLNSLKQSHNTRLNISVSPLSQAEGFKSAVPLTKLCSTNNVMLNCQNWALYPYPTLWCHGFLTHLSLHQSISAVRWKVEPLEVSKVETPLIVLFQCSLSSLSSVSVCHVCRWPTTPTEHQRSWSRLHSEMWCKAGSPSRRPSVTVTTSSSTTNQHLQPPEATPPPHLSTILSCS